MQLWQTFLNKVQFIKDHTSSCVPWEVVWVFLVSFCFLVFKFVSRLKFNSRWYCKGFKPVLLFFGFSFHMLRLGWVSTLVFCFFPNNDLFYTHRVVHIHSRELPKPATVFYCWLLSSSITAVRGVAPCSKAPRKFELRKGESLLIHVCCAHIFPAGPETKLGNSLTQAWFPHF